MIRPKRPRIELKISMTRIFTNLRSLVSMKGASESANAPYKPGSAASASAALLPLIPTDMPQMRLHMPTVNPAQNNA